MRIPSTKTDQVIYFVAVDATDLKTRKTGLAAFTVYRSRKGGAAVAYTTPTIVERDNVNMPGVYTLLIDEDTTIDAGSFSEEYCVHITCATMAPVTRTIELYRPSTDLNGKVTVVSVSADAIAANSFAAGAIASANDMADSFLGRSLAAGASGGRTVQDALRFLRNKWTLAAGVLTVYAEDDATPAWTGAVATDASQEPIVGNDPT